MNHATDVPLGVCHKMSFAPSASRSAVVTRVQPLVDPNDVLLRIPPACDIPHTTVSPVDAFFHRISAVPSSLKSPVAATFQPPAALYKNGWAPTSPAFDISHSL